jgi:hypothetical protein
MSSPNPATPFTNLQAELLRLFAAEIPEEHLRELKKIIAQFLLEKARDKADKIWDERGYTQQTIEHLLNEP